MLRGASRRTSARLVLATVLTTAIGVTAVTVTGAAAVTAAAPARTAAPVNGRILFSDFHSRLATIQPDGSHKVTIPHARYWGEAEWSPSGHQIVAVHGEHAVVMHADGSHRQRISPIAPPNETRYATSPTWSPDGRRIAYVLQLPSSYQIRIVTRSGTVVRKLTAASRYGPSELDWSPDGTKIAFSGSAHPNRPSAQLDIFTIHANGTHVRRLTQSGGTNESHPAWRPDSRRIVFEHDYFNYPGSGAVRHQIYVMRPGGGGKHSIYTASAGATEAPTWSPDGRRIAFTFRTDGFAVGGVEYGIRTMRADGTHVQQVTSDFCIGESSWRQR